MTDTTDIITESLAKFAGQFQDSENLLKMATCLLSPFVETQAVRNQLLNERWLSTAIGKQLDMLGDILGLERELNLSDDDYRKLLEFQIFVNTSQGTPEDLIKAVKFLSEATWVKYYEFAPSAGFQLFTNGEKLITLSNAGDTFFTLQLDDGGLLELDDGGGLLIHPTEVPRNFAFILLRKIAPVGVDNISLVYSLGNTPVFGFNGEASAELLELDDGGLLEVDDGETSFLEIYTNQGEPQGKVEFSGFAEIFVEGPGAIMTQDGYLITMILNGVETVILVQGLDGPIGGGKFAEGIREYDS